MQVSRPVSAVLAGLVAAACLSACGGGGGSAAPADAPTPGAPVAATSDTWPLTGLPVPAGKSSTKDHPVLVLKMDNTSSSSPQVGLGSAEMVVEELVEGGITRLAAFYYAKIPGKVGPVRSMRASDIGIVTPVGASIVTSGAAAVTIARLRKAGITYYNESAPGFYRDSSRSAPYNLFTTMTKVARAARQPPGRPPDYLPWGSDADVAAGPRARTIAATFSGGHTTDWTFSQGHYVNENTYAAPDDTFPADNVLVLRVKVGDAGYLDPAGNHVPETDFTGDGAAMLFHDGHVVKGGWHKDALTSPLQLSADGHPLTVPPGRTWIELVPAVNGSVTYAK